MPHDSLPPPRGQAPTIGVIVVSYNSAAQLPALIASLGKAAPGLALRTVVVDNGSSDASVDVARRIGVTCIDTGANRGYAAGINIGRRNLHHVEGVLVVNPDVRLGPGSVARLWESVAASGGIAVPLLRDSGGQVSRSLRREPTIGRQIGEALMGDRWAGRPGVLSEIVRDPEAYSHRHAVAWATGAVVMIAERCDEAVGPWDEDYFLFSEEVDYMTRARQAGYLVEFIPEAEATHAEGGSGRAASLLPIAALNRIRFYGARHDRRTTAVFAGAVLLEMLLRGTSREHRRAARAIIRAWRAAVRGELPPAVAPISPHRPNTLMSES